MDVIGPDVEYNDEERDAIVAMVEALNEEIYKVVTNRPLTRQIAGELLQACMRCQRMIHEQMWKNGTRLGDKGVRQEVASE